jgi:hypothetical protein
MDPQTSDQPTLGNGQHSIYTKEHAPECMTRGPRAGRTKGSGCTKGSGRTSLTQQTDPQQPSNRLRDQIIDAQSKEVKIIGSAARPCRQLQLPLAYKYPFLQPPTYWAINWARHLGEDQMWLEASGGAL